MNTGWPLFASLADRAMVSVAGFAEPQELSSDDPDGPPAAEDPLPGPGSSSTPPSASQAVTSAAAADAAPCTTHPTPTTPERPPAPPATLLDLPTGPLHMITRKVGPLSRLTCRFLCEAYGCPGTTLDLTRAFVNISTLRLPADPPPATLSPPATSHTAPTTTSTATASPPATCNAPASKAAATATATPMAAPSPSVASTSTAASIPTLPASPPPTTASTSTAPTATPSATLPTTSASTSAAPTTTTPTANPTNTNASTSADPTPTPSADPPRAAASTSAPSTSTAPTTTTTTPSANTPNTSASTSTAPTATAAADVPHAAASTSAPLTTTPSATPPTGACTCTAPPPAAQAAPVHPPAISAPIPIISATPHPPASAIAIHAAAAAAAAGGASPANLPVALPSPPNPPSPPPHPPNSLLLGHHPHHLPDCTPPHPPTSPAPPTPPPPPLARVLLTWRWRSTLVDLRLPTNLDVDLATCHAIASALPSLLRLTCACPPWTPAPPPHSPTLTSLTLHSRPNAPLTLPLTPPTLRHLHLTCGPGTRHHARSFEAILRPLMPYQTLTHLTLETTSLPFWQSEEAQDDFIAGLASHSGSLATLRLHDCRALGRSLNRAVQVLPLLQNLILDRFLDHVLDESWFPSLSTLPDSLTQLQLSDGSITDTTLRPRALRQLCAKFQLGSPTLASLTLPLVLVTDQLAPTYHLLHETLQHLSALTRLSVGCVRDQLLQNAWGENIPHWLPATHHLPCLRHLTVEMSAAETGQLADLPRLTYLNLTLAVGGDRFSDEVRGVQALRQLHDLRRLALGVRQVGSGAGGVRDMVVECLRHVVVLPRLQELDLRRLGELPVQPQLGGVLRPAVRRGLRLLVIPGVASRVWLGAQQQQQPVGQQRYPAGSSRRG